MHREEDSCYWVCIELDERSDEDGGPVPLYRPEGLGIVRVFLVLIFTFA
jgi:hypothetical protein